MITSVKLFRKRLSIKGDKVQNNKSILIFVLIRILAFWHFRNQNIKPSLATKIAKVIAKLQHHFST